MPRRVARKVHEVWGEDPYYNCFFRAVLTVTVRTSTITQLVHGHIIGAILTEGAMSFLTSSNVGLRSRSAGMSRFDAIWGIGAMVGTAMGILVTHLIYHPDDGWNLTDWLQWPLTGGGPPI
jgi:hypothetical protein